jgi:uncharacterized protein
MIVPHETLQPETLRALIEEFVTRDGAVHGHSENSLQDRVASVMRQLKSGTIVILFDEQSETCTVASREDASRENVPREPRVEDGD